MNIYTITVEEALATFEGDFSSVRECHWQIGNVGFDLANARAKDHCAEAAACDTAITRHGISVTLKGQVPRTGDGL